MTQTPLFRAPTADGRMMYALDGRLQGMDLTFFAGDTLVGPAEVIKRRGHVGQSFLIAPAGATDVRYRRPTGTRAITQWKRTREVPAFPETIAAADWAAFAKPLGYDDDGDFTAEGFYQAEYAEQQYTELSIDLTSSQDFPVNVMDPKSMDDPDETFAWDVAATQLVFGDAFAPAMPGDANEPPGAHSEGGRRDDPAREDLDPQGSRGCRRGHGDPALPGQAHP